MDARLRRLTRGMAEPFSKRSVGLGRILACAAIASGVAAASGVAHPDGRGIMLSNCAVCHQTDGKGVPGIYPPLADSVGRYAALTCGRAYLIRVVANGLAGKIGSDSYAGSMPPHRQFSDQQLADVLNYVLLGLNRKLLPKDFKPITASEVKAARMRQFSSDELRAQRDALMKELRTEAAK
jgi:mono/diheme cytochrome c family protein